jgi:hypothetical protein
MGYRGQPNDDREELTRKVEELNSTFKRTGAKTYATGYMDNKSGA